MRDEVCIFGGRHIPLIEPKLAASAPPIQTSCAKCGEFIRGFDGMWLLDSQRVFAALINTLAAVERLSHKWIGPEEASARLLRINDVARVVLEGILEEVPLPKPEVG